MKTSSSRTVRSHFPHGKKSSAVGKLSGQWLELCRYVPLVTGAALLVAGCSNNTPQVYDYEAIDRAAAQATHSLTPWERYQQRSVARELADDRERAESARSVPEAPAASSSSWGLISPAEAAPRQRPQPAPPALDPEPVQRPTYTPAPPLRSIDPSPQTDRCGWWRLRQLWC